jgi:hypothetical protein
MGARVGFYAAAAAAAMLLADDARGVTLNRQGSKLKLPCDSVKLVQAKFWDSDPDHAYVFKGKCAWWEGGIRTVDVEVSASWKNATKKALESVKVTGDKSGNIAATLSCPKDPWVNNVVCTTSGYSNNTGYAMLSYSIPLTKGLTNATEAKSKSSTPPAPTNTKTPRIKLYLPTVTPTFKAFLPAKQAAPVIASPQNGQVYSGSVLVKIQPGPGSSATKFTLQWELQNNQTAVWEIKPVVAQYDSATSPNGLNVPFASFGTAGMWRLKARAGALGFWSGYKTFGMQP